MPILKSVMVPPSISFFFVLFRTGVAVAVTYMVPFDISGSLKKYLKKENFFFCLCHAVPLSFDEDNVSLVEVMYLVFTCIRGESYCRQLRSFFVVLVLCISNANYLQRGCPSVFQ